MSDNPETDDIQIEFEEYTDAQVVEVENGYMIAPRGWGWLADHFGAAAIRVSMPMGGNIEVLMSGDEGTSWHWRKVDDHRAGNVKRIK